MIVRFANCEVDQSRVILRRDGHVVHVEPQAFDVLCYLLGRRGTVVRKTELLDQIWGDRFVSESALTTQIKSVRQAVGDDGSGQRIIRTVHGKGYEFVADVELIDDVAVADIVPPRSTRVSRLPAAMQSLIGRDALVDVLVATVPAHRLLTLVGTGGVGKTSVAYEVARRLEPRFDDGVYVIELLPVVDEGATFEAFATALDVSTRQGGSIDEAIVDVLRPRRVLLLLDNCEHLIESVAALVQSILSSAPSVSVLATSREPLAISGERVWTIPPLPTDGGAGVSHFDVADVPAVALFVERARAADPEFVLDATTASAVLEICRRVDGIPLALELAASRASAIDVVEIAARLDERFRLLRGVRRDRDPRHRTLEDAIAWSYDLLTSGEQELFAAMSVFAGQFDLGAAEAICGGDEVLDLLTRLTQRSMLAVRRFEGAGTRYELLETLREYGRRRLDGRRSVEVFGAHADHFLSVAKGVAAGLQTSDEARAITRADHSFADLRAAQRFLLQTNDIDRAFALIGSVREYAMRSLRSEVFAWAEAAAYEPGAEGHPLQPLMLGIHAYGAWVRGEYGTAVDVAMDARRHEEAHGGPPCGLVERVLANVYATIGETDKGMAEMEQMVLVAEASGNASQLTHACYMASVASSSTGALDDGRRLAKRAHEIGETTGSLTDLASGFVADAYAADPDKELALESFMIADRLARSAGNRWMSAFARTEAAGILICTGRVADACTSLAELVDLWYRAGDWSQQWHTLSRCMLALDEIGFPEIAAEACGAIDAHATMGAPPSMPAMTTIAFATRDALVRKLGEEQTQLRRGMGSSRPLVETIERVRSALLGRSLDT